MYTDGISGESAERPALETALDYVRRLAEGWTASFATGSAREVRMAVKDDMDPIDDIGDIKAFYDGDPAGEESRLAQHQLEHDLTWRYLNAYLPPRGTILEIGAATGGYTVGLARRGYAVTAFDLSEGVTAVRRARLEAAGVAHQVRHVLGDARDLRALQGEVYDAALVMGPLYHLIYEDDRRLVLRQVSGLLRPGGVIFTAFISRLGLLGDLMRRLPAWIEAQAEVRSVVEKGHAPPDRPRGGFRGYFATVEEIAPLHESEGYETAAVAAVEPAISADDEIYNVLEGAQRRAWLDLLYEISRDPSILGSSRHLLYIGRKAGTRPMVTT